VLELRGDVADGDLLIGHTKPRHHVARVGDADVRGVARRHHHRLDLVGTERIHRDGQRHRRVDAAAQAEQHPGETALANIVAHRQHQCLPHLRLEAADLGRIACRVGVDDGDRLGASREPVQHPAVGGHGDAAAVEHQFILTTDSVEVDQRQPGLGDTLTQDRLALARLVEVIRRCVEHQ